MSSSRRPIAIKVTLSAALVSALLVAFPALAHHEPRTVSGTIDLASPYYRFSVLAFDHAKCAWLTRGESSQGQLGYMIELSPTEADGRHAIRGTFSEDNPAWYGQVNATVIFYRDLGSCSTTGERLGSSGPSSHHCNAYGCVAEMEDWIPRESNYALIVPTYTPMPPWPNYCLAPWCWLPTLNGYPGRLIFDVTLGVDRSFWYYS